MRWWEAFTQGSRLPPRTRTDRVRAVSLLWGDYTFYSVHCVTLSTIGRSNRLRWSLFMSSIFSRVVTPVRRLFVDRCTQPLQQRCTLTQCRYVRVLDSRNTRVCLYVVVVVAVVMVVCSTIADIQCHPSPLKAKDCVRVRWMQYSPPGCRYRSTQACVDVLRHSWPDERDRKYRTGKRRTE